MKQMLLIIIACGVLASCAVQPSGHYDLTADEMKTAGSAKINTQASVKKLYTSAEFVKSGKQ